MSIRGVAKKCAMMAMTAFLTLGGLPVLPVIREVHAGNAPVTYVDEYGKEWTVSDYKIITGPGSYDAGWYVIKDKIDLGSTGEIIFSGNACVVLCDGASVENGRYFRSVEDLVIYGQKNKTGKISISNEFGTTDYGTMTINGGNIEIIGPDEFEARMYAGKLVINNGTVTVKSAVFGVCANDSLEINGGVVNVSTETSMDYYTPEPMFSKNITINGGNVTVTVVNKLDDPTKNMSHAIAAYDNISINGGQVTAVAKSSHGVAHGILSHYGDITLGYRKGYDDFIQATDYAIDTPSKQHISVKDGCVLKDAISGLRYKGELNSVDLEIVKGRKLVPVEKSGVVRDNQFDVRLSDYIYTYDGKAKKPEVTVYYQGKKLGSRDYRLKWKGDRIKVGKYTLEVLGKTKELKKVKGEEYFEIVKAKNPMKVVPQTASIKIRKATKARAEEKVTPTKKTFTVAKVVKVTKRKGKLTYKKVEGDEHIKINTKTGKLTVKAGLPLGEHTYSVKVTAAGDKNHKEGSKIVKAKVIVKH